MSIFVGNISRNVRMSQIEDAFEKYGRCTIRQNRSFAFIEYEDERGAEDAMKYLQGEDMGGLKIGIEWSKRSRRYDPVDSRRPHAKDRDDDRCYNCNRKGHFARDCRSRRDRSRSGSRSRSPRRGRRDSRSRSPRDNRRSRRDSRDRRSPRRTRDRRDSRDKREDRRDNRDRRDRSRSRSVDRKRDERESSPRRDRRSRSRSPVEDKRDNRSVSRHRDSNPEADKKTHQESKPDDAPQTKGDSFASQGEQHTEPENKQAAQATDAAKE